MKKDIVDNDELLKIVNKKAEEKTIEDLNKGYLDKIEQLEEALFNYMGEIDPKIFKNWNSW